MACFSPAVRCLSRACPLSSSWSARKVAVLPISRSSDSVRTVLAPEASVLAVLTVWTSKGPRKPGPEFWELLGGRSHHGAILRRLAGQARGETTEPQETGNPKDANGSGLGVCLPVL